MADIIKLKQHRKARDKAAAAAKAAENRVLHGQTKAERQQLRQRADLAQRKLDGARRDEP